MSMSIANCPMCQIEVPPGTVQRVCANCGADLSRWMPKAPPPISAVTMAPEIPTAAEQIVDDPSQFNMGLGVLGALIGAGLSSAMVFVIAIVLRFQLPYSMLGIGVLTGCGARVLYKGTGHTLGMIAGGIALASMIGTELLLFGNFPIMNIVAIVASTGIAYRLSAVSAFWAGY